MVMVLLAGLNVLIAQAICINVIFCLPDDRTQAARVASRG